MIASSWDVRISPPCSRDPADRRRADELCADPDAIPEMTDQEKRQLLADLDSRRKLVFRQCAIEDWRAEEEGQAS